MRHQIDMPHIELVNSEGAAHEPTFTMQCQIVLRGAIVNTEGTGTKKIAAKHEAAKKMVFKLYMSPFFGPKIALQGQFS